MSSLRRGHANLLCIVPTLVYVLRKRAPCSLLFLLQCSGEQASFGPIPLVASEQRWRSRLKIKGVKCSPGGPSVREEARSLLILSESRLEIEFLVLAACSLLQVELSFPQRYIEVLTPQYKNGNLLDKASLVAQTVKNLPAMRETQVRSLGWEDPLEKGMATHSSTLAWRILWTEETGGLQSIVLQSQTRLSD